MEVKDDMCLPYIVERVDNISSLADFYCGIDQMDNFIHAQNGLELFVESKLTNLWIIRQGSIVIGFFALSKSSLILNTYDIRNVQSDSSIPLKSLFEQIQSYPALKIDYIAIQKNLRSRKIGSRILGLIREKALSDELSSTLFIIVEAFDVASYSSVGFYKKNYFKESEYGIVQNQNKSRDGISVDTKLMYLPLFK